MNIQQICETYVANTYKRYPVTFVRGAGAHLWDEAGREYIDLGSGIAVNIFGVSDPIWAEAVTRQLTALPHTCNLYYAEPCARSGGDALPAHGHAESVLLQLRRRGQRVHDQGGAQVRRGHGAL